MAEEHYKDLASKPFFPALVEYILSGPVVCMVRPLRAPRLCGPTHRANQRAPAAAARSQGAGRGRGAARDAPWRVRAAAPAARHRAAPLAPPPPPQVWEGEGVVKSARKLIGATNPLEAEPGTIRGDFAVQVGRLGGGRRRDGVGAGGAGGLGWLMADVAARLGQRLMGRLEMRAAGGWAGLAGGGRAGAARPLLLRLAGAMPERALRCLSARVWLHACVPRPAAACTPAADATTFATSEAPRAGALWKAPSHQDLF